MTRSTRHPIEPMTVVPPKIKRRAGVLPTRREDDKRKRPPRHKRTFEALAEISHK